MKPRHIKEAMMSTGRPMRGSPVLQKQRLQIELRLAEEHLFHLMANWMEHQPLNKLAVEEADAVRAIYQYGHTALGELVGCRATFDSSCVLCELARHGYCELYERMWHAKHYREVAQDYADEVDSVKEFISSLEDELAELEQASRPRVRGAEDDY